MMLLKKTIFLVIIGFGLSCSGDQDDDFIEPIADPTPVNLKFPLNNTECNEGKIISDSMSEVVFEWTATSINNSYTVSLKNLETDVIKNYTATTETLPISIQRGVPYSWSVISKVTGNSKTATSDVWKFYNAGLPKESHPPFPADVVSPEMGSTVEGEKVSLKWNGSDVDNDISTYNILMDSSERPSTSVGKSNTNSIDVDIESGKVYYWKVISIDLEGNSSESEVFQFKAG